MKQSMKPILKRFIHEEEGTTAVEFAFIAMAFLTLVFGIFESGRLFMTLNAFQYTLEDTTRRALVSQDITADELEEIVVANIDSLMLDPDNVAIDIDFTEYSGVNVLEINGTYRFEPIIASMLPPSWSQFDLTAQARLPMSWQ